MVYFYLKSEEHAASYAHTSNIWSENKCSSHGLVHIHFDYFGFIFIGMIHKVKKNIKNIRIINHYWNYLNSFQRKKKEKRKENKDQTLENQL